LDIVQLLLIVVGLAVAAGGAVVLVRGANRPTEHEPIGRHEQLAGSHEPLERQEARTSGSAVPRPYISLGMIAVGLIIAYLAYSDYQGMDGLEITGLVMFGLAFAAALAVKLFITDKAEPSQGSGQADPGAQGEKPDVKRET
jgi:hypothetical protein